ncbi:MAG: response regulator [candidate division KSB1 bacterium]|nr:response regulator [candidate division KSB1 bacterium]MDZ7366151.1 response regulator [candidate division KSB1 bacterium]MDZ7404207.1 response regulator [candidate division KSB1 bacterium]
MDNPTILVADGDPKNLQILRESLEASGFEVIVASDGLQAWQKISSDVPDLILSEVNLPKLDGFQLLEKLKADPVTSSIPLMFLTNRRELQDRVRSLRGGVKDYMIKPLHVKEVIARVRMILRRMERIRDEDIESTRKLAGRLEEFSVIDLIENFGMERKTGILTLYNANNKSGEIYFRDGAVINASLANLKAEKAVYQMLPWKRGHFTMTFKEINVPDEIAVSNLGLLLQGFKRMEERERLFKALPSPETTFVTTETFRNIIAKRELTTDVAKFISLIDGKRDILQIIDESNYDDIKTLERLVKLHQQGFIKPKKTSLAGDEEMGDMVSTLAEPKIIEKLDFDPGFEQRFAGRPLEKEAPPQAFRGPEPVYVPPERKPKESATETIQTKSEVPAAPRPATPGATSSKLPPPKLPPPEIFEPPTEKVEVPPDFIAHDDFAEDFETFGEDAPSEEPPQKIEKPLEAISPALQARDEKPSAPPALVEIVDEFIPSPPSHAPAPPDKMEKFDRPIFDEKAGPAVARQEIFVQPSPPQELPTPTVTPAPMPSAPLAVTAPSEPSTPVGATPLPPSQPPADAITACLAKLLAGRPAQKPKLIVIGREGQHISPMVRHLLGAESSLRRLQSTVFQYLEIGERKVESRPFEIVGISMEQQFTRLLDTAGPELMGYIVLVEAHRKEGVEYLSYLLNMLKNVYRRPLGLAVIKSPEQRNMSIETLRDLLNIGSEDFLQECAPLDKTSVTEFLKGFTNEGNLLRWSVSEKPVETGK